MDSIVAALNALGAAQLAAVIVAVVATVYTLGKLVELIEVLVRGHAPADVNVELDELIEILGRIEDATDKVEAYGHDTFAAVESIDNTLAVQCEDVLPRIAHRDRVEDLLAQLLAATRTTTLAVQALDDDDEVAGGDDEDDRAPTWSPVHGWTTEAAVPTGGRVPDAVIVDDLADLAGTDAPTDADYACDFDCCAAHRADVVDLGKRDEG